MNATQEIESGNSSVPRWNLFSPDSVRVVSWNIDRGSKLHKVIEFLAGEKADIVLLQEADLNARRTHHINVAREIAQKLAMNYAFGREFQELTQGSKTSPAYHGQATLSRWPLSNSRIIRFQKQSHFWRAHWFLPEIPPFQERLGGRLALVSDVNIAGKTIVTYNIHLESRGDNQLRFAQLEEVLEDCKRHTRIQLFCLLATSIWMHLGDLQLAQSPTLSFGTHSRITTSQRHPGLLWNTDGSLIGFLRVVVFAASNLLFTGRFRLPTTIRYPSMWLLSSAVHVPPSVLRASASRHTSLGLWPLISAPTG
jgi:endonuclease/exonuclease/phosphatase family metal-dependent hydrolase